MDHGSAVAIFFMFQTGLFVLDLTHDRTAISYSPHHCPSQVILLISTFSLSPIRTVVNLLHWSVLLTVMGKLQLLVDVL